MNWDEYSKPTTTEYQVTLNRGDRVLEITDLGYLRMITPTGVNNGTTLTLRRYVDVVNMRSSQTLYFNNKPIHFEPPVYGENVQVDTSDFSKLEAKNFVGQEWDSIISKYQNKN